MIYKEDFEFNLLTDEELDQLINLVKEEQKERRKANLQKQYYDELVTLFENIRKAGLRIYYTDGDFDYDITIPDSIKIE